MCGRPPGIVRLGYSLVGDALNTRLTSLWRQPNIRDGFGYRFDRWYRLSMQEKGPVLVKKRWSNEEKVLH